MEQMKGHAERTEKNPEIAATEDKGKKLDVIAHVPAFGHMSLPWILLLQLLRA